VESSIGAFEAKAQLSKILRAVERGEHFTITVRGRPVADLVPHRARSGQALADAIAALQAFPRNRGESDAEVAAFVAEGRR
jgi:prevent-host-death family protein